MSFRSLTAILLFVAACCGLMTESNAFSSRKSKFVNKRHLSVPSMVLNSNNAFSKLLPLIVSGAVFFQTPNVIAEDYVPPKYDKVASWEKGIQYSVVKEGRGSTIKVGDLVEIRFSGSYQGKQFDDTFSTPEPYYYRAGVGSIVKGIDDSVLHMKVGDRWKITFSGPELSFPNGIKSSPGKPRIPAGAQVDYELELVNLPGVGDDIIADVE